MLVEDKVFYADPSSFNDPLDTRPTLEPDLDVPALEQVLLRLITYPDGSKDGLRIRRAPAKPLVSSSSNGCDLLRLNHSRTLNGPEGNSQKKLPFKPLQIMWAMDGPWMGHRNGQHLR